MLTENEPSGAAWVLVLVATLLVLGEGVGVGCAAKVAVLEPVGVALERDDLSVVDEAVDHRGGYDVVAEDSVPVRTAP